MRSRDIRYFDPLTGEMGRRVPRVTIYPKTHYVTPRETLEGAVDKIRRELRERLTLLRSEQRLVEAQRLEQRTLFDVEMMLEVGYCTGIENYSRYLSGRNPGEPPPCLFDYVPANALLFVDESHVTLPQLGGMFRGDRSRKETLVQYGFRLPSALDNRPLRFREFERISPQTIYVSATPRSVRARTFGRAGGAGRAPDRADRPGRGGPPRVTPGGRRAFRDRAARGAQRAGADHHIDQAHGGRT